MNHDAQEELLWELSKDPSRALRRHHRERLKQARRYWRWGREDLAVHPVQWGKALKTPAICSCPMCGNPRKWFGDATVQERRAWQKMDE